MSSFAARWEIKRSIFSAQKNVTVTINHFFPQGFTLALAFRPERKAFSYNEKWHFFFSTKEGSACSFVNNFRHGKQSRTENASYSHGCDFRFPIILLQLRDRFSQSHLKHTSWYPVDMINSWFSSGIFASKSTNEPMNRPTNLVYIAIIA